LDTRSTIIDRCELSASLLERSESAIAWCHLNAESDMLSDMIDGGIQVSGSDCDDRKEEVFTAFRKGQIRVLITKPKIAAYGMNWQHAHKMTYFATHSFEQYYQAIRRCWRFGQKHEVDVDLISTEAQSCAEKPLPAEICSGTWWQK
jgi:hypothetical protein